MIRENEDRETTIHARGVTLANGFVVRQCGAALRVSNHDAERRATLRQHQPLRGRS